MKKLLFGLLLTVGVSGFSFGNTISKSKELANDDTNISGCYHQTVTIYKDTCGRLMGATYSPLVQMPCYSTQPENSVQQSVVDVVVPSTSPCPTNPSPVV